MLVKEFIKRLDSNCIVSLHDQNGEFICDTKAHGKGIKPYLDNKVLKWDVKAFVFGKDNITIIIFLED